MKADIAIDTGKITGFWRSSSQHIPSLPGDTPPSMQAKHHPFVDDFQKTMGFQSYWMPIYQSMPCPGQGAFWSSMGTKP